MPVPSESLSLEPQSLEPQSLERLLKPKQIAVFGGKEAERVINALTAIGFQGDIWPLHPARREMAGRPCYAGIDQLPGIPDAAFVGVNRFQSLKIVAELSAAGVGGAVCYASGFGEVADQGEELQQRLLTAAGKMPVLGPNCYGFLNYLDGVALWPDQHGGQCETSGVAIIGQSSNILLNLTMQQRGLPIAYILAAGNQAVVGISDLLSFVLQDPRVTAVGLHVEGLDDVTKFSAVAAQAQAVNKPIVALPVGQSDTARAASLSHTASIMADDVVMRAYFRRLGVATVESLPVLLECLKLFHVFGPFTGARVSAMSCSGGEAGLIADIAHKKGVHLPALSSEHRDAVAATLPALVHVSNPLDYHTFVWGNRKQMAATFTAMLQGGFDLNMLALDWPRLDRCSGDDWQVAGDALVDAAQATGARAAIVSGLPENFPEAQAKYFMAAGIVPLFGMEEAIGAIASATKHDHYLPSHHELNRVGKVIATATSRDLTEAEAKERLAVAGVQIPKGIVVANHDDLCAKADSVGYPCVLKALGYAHKSESGAVKVGLTNKAAVLAAAAAMPQGVQGYLLEEMVEGAVAELMVGFVRQGDYGMMLTLASGGVAAELLQDHCSDLLPLTRDQIADRLGSLRLAPLLQGYRGRPVADVAGAVEAIALMQDFVLAHAADIIELEVNPLLVLPEGDGVVAVDALYREWET